MKTSAVTPRLKAISKMACDSAPSTLTAFASAESPLPLWPPESEPAIEECAPSVVPAITPARTVNRLKTRLNRHPRPPERGTRFALMLTTTPSKLSLRTHSKHQKHGTRHALRLCFHLTLHAVSGRMSAFAQIFLIALASQVATTYTLCYVRWRLQVVLVQHNPLTFPEPDRPAAVNPKKAAFTGN